MVGAHRQVEVATGWLGRSLRRVGTWARPLDAAGKQEIRCLDGLRALAALLVVAYHTLGVITVQPVLLGHNVRFAWLYLQSGVSLFFVLSGFLLFRPYVAAMLDGRPLPSARTFYGRRALRILPAYYVCMAVFVALNLSAYLSQQGAVNIGLHLVFLHDVSRTTEFAINGPFWTLAAEWQFYMLLPLIAFAIARLAVGKSRSALRIGAGVVGLAVAAFAVRAAAGYLEEHLATLPAGAQRAADLLVRLVIGFQGKFLEVFASGMLCALLYVVAVERRGWSRRVLHTLGPLLVGVAVVSAVALAKLQSRGILSEHFLYTDLKASNWLTIVSSGFFGLSYGAVVLGVLFSRGWLRGLFELTPLRYVGLWSFSLYLWHAPVIWGLLPGIAAWPLVARVALAFVVSYASYQLVERPVLAWRHNNERARREARLSAGLAVASRN